VSFFSVQSDRGDVEDLMGKVSAKLGELERSGQLGSLQTALLPSGGQSISLDDQIRTLHAQWAINPNEIIHSSRPGLGEGIRRFQRLVRRGTFWYTVPIVEQINAFNGGVVRALTGLRSHQSALQDEIDRLAVMASSTGSATAQESPPFDFKREERLSELGRQVAELSERLAELEATTRHSKSGQSGE
jgi:hypothetical protein